LVRLIVPDTASKPVVRALLTESIPELPLTRLRLSHADEGSDTWEAGRATIRFPKNAAEDERSTLEAALHPDLEQNLGAIVPALTAVVEPSSSFPYRILVFDKPRGRPGQTAEGPTIRPKPWAAKTLARDVAAALSTLHGMPVGPAQRAGVGRREMGIRPHVDVSEEAMAWAHRVVGPAVDTFVVDPLPEAARAVGATVLCHGALTGEHLYVSEDGTRLISIVGWSDVVIADPAVDFAGLAVWLGQDLLRETLARYTGPADEGTFHRALFLARSELLGRLDLVLSGEATTPKLVLDAQLRAAFAAPDPKRR